MTFDVAVSSVLVTVSVMVSPVALSAAAKFTEVSFAGIPESESAFSRTADDSASESCPRSNFCGMPGVAVTAGCGVALPAVGVALAGICTVATARN